MSRRQLIQAQELLPRLDDPNWRIVDCRFDLSDTTAGRRSYEAGHIPGAVFADLNEDLASKPSSSTGRHPLPNVETIVARMRRLGIDNNSEVVVYDGGNGAMAARAWWIFRWLGHDKVRLVDGGFSAWAAAGLPLSCATVAVQETHFVPKLRSDLVITTAEVQELMNTGDAPVLIDARDAVRFAGEEERIDAVGGHIPGARNVPLRESLDNNGNWRSQVELQDLWKRHLGDDRALEWVVMCGSGVTACHLVLSAVDAGVAEPRLYVGSWSEWITDNNRPIGLGFD